MAGVAAAGEVAAGNLQVASVEVTLMKRYAAIDCHLFGGTAAHVIVAALDDGVAFRVGEAHGAVFGIVGDGPGTRGGFHKCPVIGGIEGGCEITDSRVLVEVVGRVVGDYFRCFLCRVSVADVIVVVGVVAAADGGGGELAAVVVAEGVGYRLSVSGGASGNRAPRSIVAVGAACHSGVAAFVGHADEQVALLLIAERERHVIGLGERLQQVRAGQIGIAECLLRSAEQEACGGDAADRTIGSGAGLLYCIGEIR